MFTERIPKFEVVERNFWRNGAAEFFQRRQSVSVGVGGYVGPDRHAIFKYSSGGAVTVSKESSIVPTGVRNSIRYQVTSTASPISTDAASIEYRMEGIDVYDFRNLAIQLGQKISFIFDIQTHVAGQYHFAVRNVTSGHSFVIPFTISAPNVFETIALSVDPNSLPVPASFLEAEGWRFNITLGSGSNFVAPTTGTIQAGNYISGTGQVNALGTVGSVYVSKLRAYIGDYGAATAPEFVRFGRSRDMELVACQRYFEKSYEPDVDPTSITQQGMWALTMTSVNVNQVVRVTTPLKVFKRNGAGVGTIYNPQTGASGSVARDVAGNTTINFAIANMTHVGYEIGTTNPTSPADPRYYAHFTVENEF